MFSNKAFVFYCLVLLSLSLNSCLPSNEFNPSSLPEATVYSIPSDDLFWTVATSNNPDSATTGSYSQEINEKISLSLTGCKKMRAYKTIFLGEISNKQSEIVGVTLNIEEFRAQPIISDENTFHLQFQNFAITVTPKKEIIDQSFSFIRNEEGEIELKEETEAISYTYSTNAEEFDIEINLKVEGADDCSGSATWIISSVDIVRFI